MIVQMGNKIKNLRTKRGVTQEELAKQLNISSQAVSKWENDVSLPDMQLLPELSTYFGVTIDELFDMTDEAHLERIQNMIDHERILSREDFDYAKDFLSGKLLDKGKRADCLRLLALLYNHRAEGYHSIAATYAKEGLTLDPRNKDLHTALCEAMNGAVCDWNVANHSEIIAFYQEFMKKNPDYVNGYLWLLDNLLADRRSDEAKEVLKTRASLHKDYLYLVDDAKIKRLDGSMTEAENSITQMLNENQTEWLAWFTAGDFMAGSCQYERAVTYFEKAFLLQSKPRYTDSLEAIADICMITGQKDRAIKALQDEIKLLADEWNITTGESVDRVKRKMATI